MRVSSPKCADECVNFFVKPRNAHMRVSRDALMRATRNALVRVSTNDDQLKSRSTKWFFNMAPNSPKNSYSQNIRTLDLMELDRSRFAPADRPSTRCSDTLSCCGLRPLRVVFHFHFSFHFSEHISVRFFSFRFFTSSHFSPIQSCVFFATVECVPPSRVPKTIFCQKKTNQIKQVFGPLFSCFRSTDFPFFVFSFIFFVFPFFIFHLLSIFPVSFFLFIFLQFHFFFIHCFKFQYVFIFSVFPTFSFFICQITHSKHGSA